MSRHKLREHIFKILFLSDFHPIEGMEEQIQLYFENNEVVDEVEKKYIHDKALKIVGKAEELDDKIGVVSKGWSTSRMNKTDLSILRLALYEMKYDEDIPVSVAINEAVDIAKKYSSDEAPAFVNGILAKLAD